MSITPATNERRFSKVHVVGFTGHRHLKNSEAVAAALRTELEVIRQKGVELVAISSVAIGADSIFANEVIKAGIKWIALLPMPKEIFREDFSAEDWANAERLLAHAAQVRVLPGKGRPQSYLDCGKTTATESDDLFAVWDGDPARGLGGTGEIIAYAQTLGRKITCFREKEGRVEKVDLSRVR